MIYQYYKKSYHFKQFQRSNNAINLLHPSYISDKEVSAKDSKEPWVRLPDS